MYNLAVYKNVCMHTCIHTSIHKYIYIIYMHICGFPSKLLVSFSLDNPPHPPKKNNVTKPNKNYIFIYANSEYIYKTHAFCQIFCCPKNLTNFVVQWHLSTPNGCQEKEEIVWKIKISNLGLVEQGGWTNIDHIWPYSPVVQWWFTHGERLYYKDDTNISLFDWRKTNDASKNGHGSIIFLTLTQVILRPVVGCGWFVWTKWRYAICVRYVYTYCIYNYNSIFV